MKKLKRASLDQLAKEMPVMDENSQRSVVGGVQLFDHSGNYLGQWGVSDEIRVVSDEVYRELSKGFGADDQAWVRQSAPFDGAVRPETQQKIILSILSGGSGPDGSCWKSTSSIVLSRGISGGDSGSSDKDVQMGVTNNGNLRIDVSRCKNYHDAMNILMHETNHYYRGDYQHLDDDNYDFKMAEREALIAQINHYSFGFTSQTLKAEVCRQLIDTGMPESEANRLVYR